MNPVSSSANIEELIACFNDMPEIPAVALEVNTLLNDPDTDTHELAKIILLDPSLTAQILKICNSAAYGFSRKIATVSEAVAVLGHKVLKQIIFTIISHGCLNRSVDGYALQKGELWENAVTCAVYAKYIAQHIGFKETELVFVAALLRDIGKIALSNYISGKEHRLALMAKMSKNSFAEAEESIVGVSHTELGAEIATRWNLPTPLVLAARYHHNPLLVPQDTEPDNIKTVSIIHLADAMTMISGVGLGVDGLMYTLDFSLFKTLGLKNDSAYLESLYAELMDLDEEINKITKTLG